MGIQNMSPQNPAVLAYLKKHGSITAAEAWHKLHIGRLAARCFELNAVKPIDSRRLKVRTRHGHSFVAVYSLR